MAKCSVEFENVGFGGKKTEEKFTKHMFIFDLKHRSAHSHDIK